MKKTKDRLITVAWPSIILTVFALFTVTACELPGGEGEDTAADTVAEADTDTEVGTDEDTVPDSDSPGYWDCKDFELCVQKCDYISVEDPEFDLMECRNDCENTFPECLNPGLAYCEVLYFDCMDECYDWYGSYEEDADGFDGCSAKCNEMEQECAENPPFKCDVELDYCLVDCKDKYLCDMPTDRDMTYCYWDEKEFEYCQEMCFMNYDSCMKPPIPVNTCDEEYGYCLDSCAWDDKFCHDHCYEAFYYCKEPAKNRCEQDYDHCTDSCAWDDKFCHDHCYEAYYYCMEGQGHGEYYCSTWCDGKYCYEECCSTGCSGNECWDECTVTEYPQDPQSCDVYCVPEEDDFPTCFAKCCSETCDEWGCEGYCSDHQVKPDDVVCSNYCMRGPDGADQCWQKCCGIFDDYKQEECWELPLITVE